MKLDVLAEQRVGPDHDVDRARRQALADLGQLLGRHEARDLLDAERQALEALAHHLVVLADEQRRRGEDRDLPARHGDHERGAERHLGLAEADVAADQPVHRLARGQIVEHGLDRARLILGLVVGEARRELLVQAGRRGELRALAQRAARGDLDQLARDLADPLLDPGLPRLPAEPAELVERDLALGRAIAREDVEVLDRHEQLVAALVDQAQAVVGRAAELERDQPVVAADAMVVVDHEIALAEGGDLGDELVAAARPPRRPAEAVADDVGLGQDRELGGGEAVLERQHRERRPGRRAGLAAALDPVQPIDAVIGEHEAQPLERALAGAGDHDLPAGGLLVPQVLRDGVEQVDVLARPFGREVARPMAAEIDRPGRPCRRRAARRTARNRSARGPRAGPRPAAR